jgi:hypothetical protein
MKYQTDFTGYILKDGCLACEITTIAEELTGLEMSNARFEDMINFLHFHVKTSYDPAIPAVSDEHNIKLPGAFVWDHEAVFNESFCRLGTFHRMEYTGRIYMPWEEAKGHTSFGERKGDFIILQIKTPNGGHFRGIDHDPYRPGTKMVDLKSLRFYTLV